MKKVKVGKSKIHGNGLFADERIKRGDVIQLVHTMRELEPGVMKTTPTLLGRNYNHSEDSNALNVVDGNNRYLVALKEIEAGGEITTDYRSNPELEQPGSFASNDNYISFDYDDTLTTPEGFKLAQQMNKEGKNLYVITARDKVTPQMIERAEAAGIPKENIITAGSDEEKVRIIKENNISKHIDNKESVIKALGDTGELFSPDAYPDLKADFIEMNLTTDDLNKLKEGGFIVEESPDKGIITQEEIDAANNAMMKARLAYAYMHGNPAAQRMVVAPDQPYDFGDGMTGTHYMASMDNYAVPQIQDVNGQLMLGDYGPESAEAIRFDTDQDANYFAENYKQVTPDPSYRQEEYAKGGDPGKGKKGKSKNVQPFITSNPEEYAYRKAAYDDSLRTYQMAPNLKRKENYIDAHSLSMKDNRQQLFNLWKQYGNKGFNFDLGYNQRTSPKRKVSDGVIGHQIYNYKKPVQPVQFKKPKSTQGATKKIQPIVEQEVIEPTLVSQPIPTPIIVNSELQKFVEEERKPGTGLDVMPVYDTDELPMYATPDGGAEWIGDTERYVDWDGNRIPYRLPRFRKPGHGGDLIRRGKQRYIPFPSIESRYQAEIVPEEEFKKGGYIIEDISVPSLNQMKKGGGPKKKKRKTDDYGRYRSEDGNVRTPLTPEMQAVMPPDEWGQYIQEFPEVYTTRTKEQQDIRNALDYQQRMAELYPGRPTQSDAIQPADWFWQLGMLGAASGLGKSAVGAAETLGTKALPYLEGALNTSIPGMASIPGATISNAIGAGFAADAMVNRIPEIPGQLLRGEYGDAVANVITSGLDIAGAGLVSPIYQGAKSTASELGKFLGTEEGLLSNAYKANPFAFKPQEGMMYRGLGQEGFTDAVQSGVFRPKQLEYSPERSFAEIVSSPKQFESTYYAPSDKFGVVKGYGPKYVAEVPFEGNQFNRRYKGKNWSWSTPREIPIEEGRILQKDWLRGYKEVPRELPGSPNSNLELGKASRTIYPEPIVNSMGLKEYGKTINAGPVWGPVAPTGAIKYNNAKYYDPALLPEELQPYMLSEAESMQRYPRAYMDKDQLIGHSFKLGRKKPEYPTVIPANFNTQEDILARILGKPLPSRSLPKVYYDLNGNIIQGPKRFGGITSKLNKFIR